MRTSTGVPARTRAAADSGTSALIHTEPRPLIRNSGVPIATVMPSRTASSVTTPPIGAVTIVIRGCTAPVRDHPRDLLVGHAGKAHALPRGVDQRIHARAFQAAHREILLLRGDPVGHVELEQRLALAHRVERRAHEELLDEAVGARLHDRLVALVERDAADRRERRGEARARWPPRCARRCSGARAG